MERRVKMILLGFPAWCMAVDRNVNMLELAGRKKALHYSLSFLRQEEKTPNKSQNPNKKSKC